MNWSDARLLIFSFVLSPLVLLAQEATPAPSPSPAPPPVENGGVGKISFLRVWYFGTPKSKRITLLCQQGTGEPGVLGSYIRAGEVRSYRPFKSGSYVLSTVDGSVIPDANGRIAAGSPPIGKNVTLDLKPGTHMTVVVQEKDGKFSTETLEDKLPENPTGPTIRVFDFSGKSDASVRLINGQKTVELWSPKMANPLVASGVAAGGDCRFEFWRTIDNQARCIAAYEKNLSGKGSCSVVIYTDRYGEPSMSVTDDANGKISADELKGLTQSPTSAPAQ